MFRRHTKALFFLSLFVLLICVSNVRAASFETLYRMAPEELETEQIWHYASAANDGPTLEALKNHPAPKYAAEFVRMVYTTTGVDGKPVEASGLVIFPDKKGEVPALIYNIGMTFEAARAPSNPKLCTPTLVMAILFASQGYGVIMPDYIGQGYASKVPHPFLHKSSTVSAVLDLIEAAGPAFAERSLNIGPMFMSGMSQGGWATAAALREYEKRGGVMAGAMPIAPVVDLPALGGSCLLARASLEPMKPFASWLCAKLFLSYRDIYGVNLSGVFQPEMENKFAEGLNGRHTLRELMQTLPTAFHDVFTEEGRADVLLADGDLQARLEENSCEPWSAKTPVRFCVGAHDGIARKEFVKRFADKMIQAGAEDVALIDAGPLDHNATALSGMVRAFQWFESLRR